MSGTLGDVYLFRPNGGFPGVAAEDSSGGMAIEEKDGGGLSSRRPRGKDSSTNNSALGNTNIEWQPLLKDGVNANAGNRSMFGDSDSSSGFPALSHQKFHFMGSLGSLAGVAGEAGGAGGAGGAGSGGPWDCSPSTAVNYLQAFGPVSSGSSGGVDRQLGEIRLAVDGQQQQQQMLTDVLRRPGSSCEVPAEVGAGGGVKEEKDFDSSSNTSSHILQGVTIPTSNQQQQQQQQQQLFAAPHSLMPSPASMQQLNRSPNHAIRNLFPEKSSGFSSNILQSHEQSHDLGGGNKIDEQALLQLSKKPRMQDYGDGGAGPASPAAPLSEADNANRLAHGGASGQYRKLPFVHNQRSNALGSLIDCSSTYSEASPTTSFSPAFPPSADRPAAFSAALSSLQPIGLSSFRSSAGCPLIAMKNSSNESMAMKSPIIDYGRYTLDPSSRMQGGGDYRGELGGDRDPSSFLGVSSPQCGLNFMPLVGSLGAGPYNFSSRRQNSLDTGGRGAWPAGLISNIPSLSMETPSRPLLPSKRTLHEREQPEGLLEERDARRVHPVTESRRRMLIQKQLTTTDVGSLGRIILPKKEAETHLPHLPDKEGIEMYLYDYEADRTWTMKYRFWPNNKSRMYLLENTGEFAKFHALQQGDWLFIYRESSTRYVLRAKKSAPLLQVTPSSQSVTEVSGGASAGPAAAPAEDVGGPASSSGRPTNQTPSPVGTTNGGSGTPSSSKEGVCGGIAPAASSNQLSLDVPTSRFSASSTGASQSPAQVLVEAKKPAPAPPPPHQHPPHDQLPSSTMNPNSKHLVDHLQQAVVRAAPAGRASASDAHHHEQQHHQELRMKNYMAVQQQHQQQSEQDMPSELDGGGDFNLEDFPRLIEADDETIDNILGHSDSQPTAIDGRSRTVSSLRGRADEEASSSSRRSI